MCSFCDEAGDDNNDTGRLDRQPRLICTQEKLYWGRRKYFFFSVSSLSNAKDIFSKLRYLHSLER